MLKNIKFFNEICKNPEMTMEEIETHKEIAIEKEDNVMLALLCMAQVYKETEQEKGREQIDNRCSES